MSKQTVKLTRKQKPRKVRILVPFPPDENRKAWRKRNRENRERNKS